MASALLAAGADVDLPMKYSKQTALHLAAGNGDMAMVKELLRKPHRCHRVEAPLHGMTQPHTALPVPTHTPMAIKAFLGKNMGTVDDVKLTTT